MQITTMYKILRIHVCHSIDIHCVHDMIVCLYLPEQPRFFQSQVHLVYTWATLPHLQCLMLELGH